MDRVAVLMLTAVGAVICQYTRMAIFPNFQEQDSRADWSWSAIPGSRCGYAATQKGGEAMMKPWPMGEPALSNLSMADQLGIYWNVLMYWNVLKCTEICWNRSTPHNYNQLCQSAKAGFLDISWIITTYIVIILRLELPWRTWKWWHICGNWMFAMMFSWTIRATLPCNVHLQQYVYYISLYTIFTMLIYIYYTEIQNTVYNIYIPINCYMQRYSERICKELL